MTVSDVTYFGSQPWPFPDSLMIGFHAKYLAGDIEFDGVEIEDASKFMDLTHLELKAFPLTNLILSKAAVA